MRSGQFPPADGFTTEPPEPSPTGGMIPGRKRHGDTQPDERTGEHRLTVAAVRPPLRADLARARNRRVGPRVTATQCPTRSIPRGVTACVHAGDHEWLPVLRESTGFRHQNTP